VSVAARLAHLRRLLRRGTFTFDAAVHGADRVTVATTLFALLELHKRGEATWRQDEPFGEITIGAREAEEAGERGATGRRERGTSRATAGGKRSAAVARERDAAAAEQRSAA
jgi:hypothetical protein